MGSFVPGPLRPLSQSQGRIWDVPPGTFWSADLSTPVFGFGLAPGLAAQGLVFSRAASLMAVQSGTSSVFDLSFLSATADVYITSRFDDAHVAGMALGGARTNFIPDSSNFSAGSWVTGGTVTRTATQPGPTGTNSATRLQCASGSNYIIRDTTVPTGALHTGSMWLRPTTPPANIGLLVGGTVALTSEQLAASAAWRRYFVTVTPYIGNSVTEFPVDGRASYTFGAGARDWTAYGAQLEVGAFPSDPIPTAGVTATRAATFLNLTAAKVAEGLIGGRIQLELNLRAQGSRGEIGGSPHFAWADANNRITIDTATGIITIAVGGATNTTAALNWARYDAIDIFVCFGGSVATTFLYRINSGAWASLAITGSALGNITPANTYLLSQSTAGAHLDGWLYKVAAWQPNRRPSWALN